MNNATAALKTLDSLWDEYENALASENHARADDLLEEIHEAQLDWEYHDSALEREMDHLESVPDAREDFIDQC